MGTRNYPEHTKLGSELIPFEVNAANKSIGYRPGSKLTTHTKKPNVDSLTKVQSRKSNFLEQRPWRYQNELFFLYHTNKKVL